MSPGQHTFSHKRDLTWHIPKCPWWAISIVFFRNDWGGTTQPAIICSKLTIETLEQRCEICSNLTIKLQKRRQWRRFGGFLVNFEHTSHLCSSVSIVNFEHVIAGCVGKHWRNGSSVSNGSIGIHRRSYRRCSGEKVFLKILQYSQRNTCVGVHLLKTDSNTDVLLRILWNF